MLCDIIVLYCMKKRYFYREKKYKYVEDYEVVSTNKGRMEAGLFPSLILKQDIQSPYHTQTLYCSCEETVFLGAVHFYLKAVGRSTRNNIMFPGQPLLKREAYVRELNTPTASLFGLLSLAVASCMLQSALAPSNPPKASEGSFCCSHSYTSIQDLNDPLSQ